MKQQELGPAAIDLFSGCGGLTQGLKAAGFRVIAAVEIEAKAQATYKANHPSVALYGSDIRKLDPERVLQDLGLQKGELGLLAGCPPCQGFSRLRTRNRRTASRDDRNGLVKDFLRFVGAMLPKTVMLENVPALANDARFLAMQHELEYLGYTTLVRVLDAADYGVPQRRKRLILLASRVHAPSTAPIRRKVTVRKAISKLENPSISADPLHGLPESRSVAVQKIIALIPPNGGSRRDLPREHQLPCHLATKGFYDVYGRMSWDDVAPTITSGCHNPSKGRFLHPVENRTITLREASLLQGFPRTYKFDVAHGKEALALMIGNALPPPFIKAQAQTLAHALSPQAATG